MEKKKIMLDGKEVDFIIASIDEYDTNDDLYKENEDTIEIDIDEIKKQLEDTLVISKDDLNDNE